MNGFFEWCIGIGLFFIGISVVWNLFWLALGIITGIIGWLCSLFEGDE